MTSVADGRGCTTALLGGGAVAEETPLTEDLEVGPAAVAEGVAAWLGLLPTGGAKVLPLLLGC